MTREHHELIVADQHAQETLDRKRAHLERAQRWTVTTPEIVVVDAPDVSQCCNAPTSVDEHAVVYCKRCYRPV